MGLAGGPLISPGYDIDPISPGVQTQKGILTATGPSRVVPNNGMVGGELLTSGFGGVPGFGSGYAGMGFRTSGVGMIDADPITPGIQAQPGIVTPTGPPRIVGGPGFVGGGMMGGGSTMMTSGVMTSGYRGVGIEGVNTTFGGGLIDADPITPGFQAQPGVLTSVGPPAIVGVTGGAVGGALSNALGGTLLTSNVRRSGLLGFDADPVTPGIQAQPGIVTSVGPTQVVGTAVGYGSGIYGTPGYVGRSCWSCCPWWLWIVLGLLLLGGLVGGLFALNQENHVEREKRGRTVRITTVDEDESDRERKDVGNEEEVENKVLENNFENEKEASDDDSSKTTKTKVTTTTTTTDTTNKN